MVTEVKSSGASVVTLAGNSAVKCDKPVAPTAETAGSGRHDVVQLTDLAARLQSLTQTIADVPQVDAARVNALRQAIDGGDYQIDAEAVADKLIAFEGLLAGRSET